MSMIEVSKINGDKVWINPDLLRKLELTPDTVITFVGDAKLVVAESPEEIERKIIQFKRKVYQV